MVTLVTCKQSFPLFSGRGDGCNFGSIGTSSVLLKEFASKQQRGHRRIAKSPQHMPGPCLKVVAFRVARLCGSPPASSCSPSGPAACKPAPSPVLRAHLSHTARPDAAHLRQLASVTSWLGLDPSSSGQSAECTAFAALERHCWWQQRASSQTKPARQLKRRNCLQLAKLYLQAFSPDQSEQRPDLCRTSPAVLPHLFFTKKDFEGCFSPQQIRSCATRTDEILSGLAESYLQHPTQPYKTIHEKTRGKREHCPSTLPACQNSSW